MTSEHKDWVKGEQNGNMKGVKLFIPWDVLGPVLGNKKKIPDDVKIKDLRFKRYPTRNNIIVDVKWINPEPEGSHE